MALNYSVIDTQDFDYYLWFWKKNVEFDKKMYKLAVSIGKNKGQTIFVNKSDIKSLLKKDAVGNIFEISKEVSDLINEKAYFIANDGIYWCPKFSENLLQRANELSIDTFNLDQKMIDDSILLHEYYHFLEFRDNQFAHEIIEKLTGINCPQIYREIAAFSFVNAILHIKCQLIDLLWLKVYAPKYYSIIKEKMEKNIK